MVLNVFSESSTLSTPVICCPLSMIHSRCLATRFQGHQATTSFDIVPKRSLCRNFSSGHLSMPEKTTGTDKSNNTVEELSDLVRTLNVSDQNEELRVPADLIKVADWISGKKPKGKNGAKPKILVLTGAGVSVAAGIPDFRTPGTGLYDNLQTYNLPYPEAVFDVKFYRDNPDPFCALAKEIWPGLTHSPTLTHSFLSLLSKKGLLSRNYTQNIDGLEFLAGIPADEIVEAHGHFRSAACIECNAPKDGKQTQEIIVEKGQAPTCDKCDGYVKPDIVFFGESLPARFHRLLKKDLAQADMLLVMGTSLQVAPVSLIPDMVSCKRALFNRDLVMRLKRNDAFVEGDCDTNIQLLCKLLGWEDELLEANRRTMIVGNKEKPKGKTAPRRGKYDKS